MRDLLVFAIVILSLPTSIRRPFFGLLVFSWLAYMRPQDLCWSFARTMRLSFLVGFAMLLGWWAHEQGRRRFVHWDFRTVAMLVLTFFLVVSYAFARVHDDYTNTYFVEFLKIVVIALFTTAQVDTYQRLRVLLWTIALSLGFFGVKNGLLGILGGGTPILRGPGGMLEDNNDFGLALVMNIPLLWYLGIAEGKAWIRHLTRVAVFLTVATIVLTHSRGAFLALGATALWMAWRSGHLLKAVGFLMLVAAIFPLVVPESVIERLASIGDTKESSASARLTAWATALRMIEDNPLLGVGLRNFQTRFAEYSVVPLGEGARTYVAHNSYLQIWAESGSLAFVAYLALLGSVFPATRRVFRMATLRPDLGWAAHYARMMEATVVGFLVGAVFLNRGHFDLIYHWLALTTSLVLIVRTAWQQAPASVAATAPARRRVSVRIGGAPALAGGLAGAAKLVPRWR